MTGETIGLLGSQRTLPAGRCAAWWCVRAGEWDATQQAWGDPHRPRSAL